MSSHNYDVLIIGSGCAGLTLALQLSKQRRIAVLCKGLYEHTATYWAQGGIAAVLAADDTIDAHVHDTLQAGAGLCHADVVEFTVAQSADCIDWLVTQGVNFSRDKHTFHLSREGGHSHRRVIHAADATGQVLAKTLTERVLAAPNISILSERVAVDLVVQNGRCRGVYALNVATGKVEYFAAHYLVLATGGASKAYLYTSNPDGATGDGVAMAWRGGCRVANMEFNQFHPTCLYHPQAKSFLITEAMRGEGGRLLLPDGEPFMQRFDPRADLASRDIVARAIDHEMKRLGIDCVYLAINHQSPAFLLQHFPTVKAKCLELGIDITRDPIPVVPAAHYTCGGVMVDKHGRTDISHLYAIGETSFTGLHGANRMASNSLLECLVFGRAAARHIEASMPACIGSSEACVWDESRVEDAREDIMIAHNWEELRRLMWDYVGIVRTDQRLRQALRRVVLLRQEIDEYYRHYTLSKNLVELRHLVTVAELMIRSARQRKESRGLHYTLDYPGQLSKAVDTILDPAEEVHNAT